MSRSIRTTIALLFAAAFTACTDSSPITAPGDATAGIRSSDVVPSTSGARFEFIYPLSAEYDAPTDFDSTLAPSVEVCAVTAAGECGETVARFPFDARKRGVKLDVPDRLYVADWNTGRCETGPCTLATTPKYRIRAIVAGATVGSADVVLLDGTARPAKRDRDPSVALYVQNGNTIPVRFWIAPAPPAPAVPTWHQLAPSDPVRANVAATAYVPSADAVFALIGGDNTACTLWKFDLSTNSWSLIPTSNFPIGSYRKLIHDPATHSFITYWDGLGQAYRVPETGGAWTPIGSTGNSGSYYVGAAYIDPFSGHLRQLDGYGFYATHDDLWDLSPASGQWTAVAQSATRPWPRIAPIISLDEAHAQLYMTEGQGNASGSQFAGVHLLDDVWRLDLATNSWTNVLPLSGAADNRQRAFMAFTPSGTLLRFGGYVGSGKDQWGGVFDLGPATFLNDVISLDLHASAPSWQPVTTEGVAPSARYDAGVFFDAARNRMLVFGGATKTGYVMDVWALAF